MRVAYEDVRFAPRSPLTMELMSCSLEAELSEQSAPRPTEPCPTDPGTINSHNGSDNTPNPTPDTDDPARNSTHAHPALLGKQDPATHGGEEILDRMLNVANRIAVVKLLEQRRTEIILGNWKP